MASSIAPRILIRRRAVRNHETTERVDRASRDVELNWPHLTSPIFSCTDLFILFRRDLTSASGPQQPAVNITRRRRFCVNSTLQGASLFGSTCSAMPLSESIVACCLYVGSWLLSAVAAELCLAAAIFSTSVSTFDWKFFCHRVPTLQPQVHIKAYQFEFSVKDDWRSYRVNTI